MVEMGVVVYKMARYGFMLLVRLGQVSLCTVMSCMAGRVKRG